MRQHQRECVELQPASSGVYGLQIRGVESSLLAPVSAHQPVLDLSITTGRVSGRSESFGGENAEISLLADGWVSVTRDGRARFVLPEMVSSDELIHPWLVPAAATMNGWLGRQVLHGGAVSFGGRAVVVLGHKEDGKSSLLAWLAQASWGEVLADDLAVIDAGRVLAGPRCIDLRPASLCAIENAGRLRLVRDGDRLRMDLPPCARDADLAAIVVLRWSEEDDVVLDRLRAYDGFAAVLPHAMRAESSGDLLDLLTTPVWTLRRPRNWESMPEVAACLRDVITQTGLPPVSTASESPVPSGAL